jgi:hypothetical protein
MTSLDAVSKVSADKATDEPTEEPSAQLEVAGKQPARFTADALQDGRGKEVRGKGARAKDTQAKDTQPCRPGLSALCPEGKASLGGTRAGLLAVTDGGWRQWR